MTWLIRDFKDLPRRTAADKVSRDKTFNIAKNPKYDRYQRGLASMGYNFFNKKASNKNKGTGINSVIVSKNKELTKDIHKPVIKNFRNKKCIHLL